MFVTPLSWSPLAAKTAAAAAISSALETAATSDM